VADRWDATVLVRQDTSEVAEPSSRSENTSYPRLRTRLDPTDRDRRAGRVAQVGIMTNIRPARREE
jgi:hypothetical protein